MLFKLTQNGLTQAVVLYSLFTLLNLLMSIFYRFGHSSFGLKQVTLVFL